MTIRVLLILVFAHGPTLVGLHRCKGYKRLYYNFIVADKLVIEIIKTKEGLDPLYSIRGFLVIDYVNLLRVNFNSIYTYYKPKALYMFYPKFIFPNINL